MSPPPALPLMGSAFKPLEKKIVVFVDGQCVEFSEREAEEIHELLGAALQLRGRAKGMAGTVIAGAPILEANGAR